MAMRAPIAGVVGAVGAAAVYYQFFGGGKVENEREKTIRHFRTVVIQQ